MKKLKLKRLSHITEQSLARENEIFIGYFSLDDFKKMKYCSKRLDKSLYVKGIDWFAVYINKLEWKYPTPKRHNLRRSHD